MANLLLATVNFEPVSMIYFMLKFVISDKACITLRKLQICCASSKYSRTSVARILMAHLPCCCIRKFYLLIGAPVAHYFQVLTY